jgi:excisionase family DNA binding protein
MNAVESLAALDRLLSAPRAEKLTREWQAALWQHWPTAADWPVVLDLSEAAAYLRMHPATLRKHCAASKLRHQRIGAAYRLQRADLDAHGVVEAKTQGGC